MRSLLMLAGLGLVAAVAVLPAGCTPGTRSCVTFYETCQADEAGPAGHACYCRYPDYIRAGVYEGGP